MKEFKYVIQDAQGIHARPAGILVKAAGGFKSDIQLDKDGRKGDLKRIFGVMGLCVKTVSYTHLDVYKRQMLDYLRGKSDDTN